MRLIEQDAAEAAWVDWKGGCVTRPPKASFLAGWRAGAAFVAEVLGSNESQDAGPLGSGHSPRATAREAGDCGGSVEDPSTHLIHGPASDSSEQEPAQCTHEGGEWPELERCADCGQPLGSSEPSPTALAEGTTT